ncbi:hypothetical protein [Streptomyces sp. NBC_01497]|uniref:hypothetical protein n=1 Tax=Streptomyces sp. NBC_01497 TaxID=2903885 RepID=UPI002E37962C|nr:hypothetical protein [Streptomyces sp. NBC_01497]
MNRWQMARAAFLVCGLAAGLVGCGGGGDEAAKTIPATQVCDGRISSAGAASVEFLTGTKKFSPSGNDLSDVTLPKVAAALSNEWVPKEGGNPIPKPACAITTLKGGSAELSVGFSTTTSESADGPVADTLKKYDVGRRALVGVARAYLYFDCASPKFYGSTQQKPAVVLGQLTNNAEGQGRYHPKGGEEKVREANLTVLHSLSLVMAKELGCVGNAGLTSDSTFRPGAEAT